MALVQKSDDDFISIIQEYRTSEIKQELWQVWRAVCLYRCFKRYLNLLYVFKFSINTREKIFFKKITLE